MFVFARVFMGFGLPTLLTSSAALLHELVYPKERAPIASLLSVSYYPGAIVGSGITLSKGRNEEAYAILTKYHAEGDRDHPLVKAEYEEIVKNIEIEMTNTGKAWRTLFATKPNRWRVGITLMVGCYSQFSG
jgi:hypothetical protein